MVHPEILWANAKAHRDDLLREAAVRRVVRQVPPGSSSRWRDLLRNVRRRPQIDIDGQHAQLRDGATVLIRQVSADDAPLLAEGFARLSAQSRLMRFQLAKKVLSNAELRYLTEVDHCNHEALGALALDTGKGVGVARYIRDAKDERSAELAVTVLDDWQHRGLGSELVTRLADRAREEGLHRFTAQVAVNNVPATKMLQKLCATELRRDAWDAEYELALHLHHPCGAATL
jgi:RimJ/RimL family protein N-acetyltransferase